MFAYCENNPVIGYDPIGKSATIAGVIVGGLFGGIAAIRAGASLEDTFLCAMSGAITGAMAGFCADVAVATCGIGGALFYSAIGSGLMGATNSICTQSILMKYQNEKIQEEGLDELGIIHDGVTSAVFGGLGAGPSIYGPIIKSGSFITKPGAGIKYAYQAVRIELSQLSMGMSKKV